MPAFSVWNVQHPDTYTFLNDAHGRGKPVLIGEADPEAGDAIAQVYRQLVRSQPAYCRMSPLSAELTKLATNCFLTMKISFANAIGDLATSGLVIDSFTIQAIGGEALEYMELVGRKELAYRERDARMAQAEADEQARVREAKAEEVKLNADRGVQLRDADVKQETDRARAVAGSSTA